MGAPKATAELEGRPLISYAIDAALAAGLVPLVITKTGTELPTLECELLIEADDPSHPALGIVKALDHVVAPVVVLPCDAPLVPAELIADLAERPAAFAMPVDPRPQPLVARYTPALLPRIREAVATREPLVALAEDLGGERLVRTELSAFGDPEWMFVNANDPAELERIAAELRRSQATGPDPQTA